MTQSLQKSETILSGHWVLIDSVVIQDEVSRRIDWLTNNSLQLITVSGDNWSALYINPEDGGYWLLTYPNSDWHGGGPPQLERISEKNCLKKCPDLSKLLD